MCSELKALYVLITRTKHCVLFYEDDHKTARPVLDLWQAEEVVQMLPLEEVSLACCSTRTTMIRHALSWTCGRLRRWCRCCPWRM